MHFESSFLCYREIYKHQKNMVKLLLADKSSAVITKLRMFLNEQQAFMEEMVAGHKDDPYWRSVGMILAQYKGLVDGYNQVSGSKMVSAG